MNTNTEKKKLSLAVQIFIALVLAVIVGIVLQNYADFTQNYIKPFGTIFLNLLKFIVCPIVLVSILSGIISMSDIRKVGSIGAKTVIYYLCTTAFATCIGLAGAVVFKSFSLPVILLTRQRKPEVLWIPSSTSFHQTLSLPWQMLRCSSSLLPHLSWVSLLYL